MTISTLFTDPATGELSHTKLWSNIANAVASFVVVKMALTGTLSAEIFVGYLAVVGASAVASKYLSLKFNKGTDDGTQK